MYVSDLYRYLQERIRQVEDERSHALSTISKYKVFINFIVIPQSRSLSFTLHLSVCLSECLLGG